MTFERYLREAHDRLVIDHALRVRVHEDGAMTFYIHPMNTDGDTRDFEVHGDVVIPDPRVQRSES